MNIEEAKRKLHNMAYRDLQTKPYDLKLADVIQILNQIKLDQLKPEVPQFVADWYEKNKNEFYLNLHRLAWEFIELPDNPSYTDFKRWYYKDETAIKTLINMHQFGYTIEKEKLYTVKIPNPNGLSVCLQRLDDGNVVLSIPRNARWKGLEVMQLTEAEIRKDFEWAWREGFSEEVTK
ncbi:DUF1642 domain-containing protein [Streptococcus dysgalactiae]|uniref:DUF1642 domain-containing protein n=1 Tax=Streptococcus dysgalactiae TaxID=1334 RepID=UPI001C9DF7E7|nr:DUF1642 domain-containing protein [Streptococcus dysgalactiae]QZT28079.1 DUF1642 domain-containing protein [Streptococcus dysgalactiae]